MEILRNLKTKKVIRTAGLMTGTSMDGLDIYIADIGLSNNTADFNMIGTTSYHTRAIYSPRSVKQYMILLKIVVN